MKVIIQSLIVFALLILVTAADAYQLNGQIKVENTALRVKRTDGFKSRFYKGQYKMSFEHSRKSVLIRIDRKGITTDIPLNLSGLSIPANGNFTLPASKTGQTFDVDGNMKTTSTQSKTFYETWNCTYEVEEWVCHGRGRRRYCDWEMVEYDGIRDVEYHYITKKKQTTMTLSSNNGGGGIFTGQASSKKREFSKYGRCVEPY